MHLKIIIRNANYMQFAINGQNNAKSIITPDCFPASEEDICCFSFLFMIKNTVPQGKNHYFKLCFLSITCFLPSSPLGNTSHLTVVITTSSTFPVKVFKMTNKVNTKTYLQCAEK